MWLTITSIATSIMLLTHNWLPLLPLISFCIYTYYTKTFQQYFNTLLLCIGAAICIFFRIEQQTNNFVSDQNFLNKPLIVRGYIQQIQTNALDKPTTTILLQTINMYNQDAGSLSSTKILSLQIPSKRAQNLQTGQKIVFYKLILQQPQLTDPYATYLIKEGIWATAYITTERFFVYKKNNPYWYQCTLDHLSHYFDQATAHLYNPLFLGKKEHDQQAIIIQHQSLYWGIAHHMARSGIHLVTLLGLCIAFFHYARIRSRARYGIYALLATGYWLITISSVSFIRSLCMILIQMFSRIHGYQYSSIHAFILTTLLVIQYNPRHILFLDFQLSFGITAVIIWLFYAKWTKTVAFLPSPLAPS